jgi:hypothetical protein
MRIAGLGPQFQAIPEWQSVVIWKPDQVFEKSEKKGRFLEREIALFLYAISILNRL